MRHALLGAVAFLFAATAAAQMPDEPQTVYLKLHRATLVQNLNEMLLYSSDSARSELKTFAADPTRLKLVAAMMPRVYNVRASSITSDGTRARLRATGTFTIQGNTAPSDGIIDHVRQSGEWKVDKFEWSGDKPQGFDEAVAQARLAAKLAAGQVPEEAPAAAPKPAAEPAPEQPTLSQRKPARECVIKPVMSDDDLRACGSKIPE